MSGKGGFWSNVYSGAIAPDLHYSRVPPHSYSLRQYLSFFIILFIFTAHLYSCNIPISDSVQ